MIKKIFLIYILFICSSIAQTSNGEFYPLKVGNKWEYINLAYEVSTIPDTTYYTKEIIGDTLLSNGYDYFVVKENNRIFYERFDSLNNEIKYFEHGGCGDFDNSKYSLAYNPDSTILWKQCGEIPYFITYENTSNEGDSASIILERDYLYIEYTEFKKHLGIYYQSFLEGGMYVTRLIGAIIDGKRWGTTTSIPGKDITDFEYKLYQNYPNPFNPVTTINYSLPKQNIVTIVVYDMLGRAITTLINEVKSKGFYSVNFNGKNLSSGIYFYTIRFGDFLGKKKMILIK
ncbi:MAG: T9SS type A sorting domain-containing protein [Bacteroidetes bacterium]|nr:T9SS type A sorting domain-containing protein [Bacteroidota bacterium]